MNIKINNKKVHVIKTRDRNSLLGHGLTRCGIDFYSEFRYQDEMTTEPLTCKTCIKLEAKK